jgi:hypothetical protein
MIELKSTSRGLLQGEFKDRNGRECVVQESSFPIESCLWLGVDVNFDGEPVTGGRMHVSQELAKELLPILRYFARTGSLGYDDPKEVFQVGTWVLGVGPDNKGVYGRIIEVSPGHYLKVQDNSRLPPAGQISCDWSQADLIWDVTQDRQEIGPTTLERILNEEPNHG